MRLRDYKRKTHFTAVRDLFLVLLSAEFLRY
jgi:hypothetical protein